MMCAVEVRRLVKGLSGEQIHTALRLIRGSKTGIQATSLSGWHLGDVKEKMHASLVVAEKNMWLKLISWQRRR